MKCPNVLDFHAALTHRKLDSSGHATPVLASARQDEARVFYLITPKIIFDDSREG